MFANAYHQRRILITGNTGFKGSWLTYWLEQLGAKVFGYAKDFPTKVNHYQLLKLDASQKMGDVLDTSKLTAYIKKIQPDLIFHLAAQPLVLRSYENPLETFLTNAIGTASILEAVRKSKGVKAVVNITTDKVYQNLETGQDFMEDDPLGGFDPYSASKACSEIVTASYRSAFFALKDAPNPVAIATARSGNVIGGGDWADNRLLPDLVRAQITQTTLSIRNPASTRPWQHVLEPLSGYLWLGVKLLTAKQDFSSAWNFGSDSSQEISVKQVVTDFKKIWPGLKVKLNQPINFHEAGRLKLNSTKAEKKLGWKNVWSYQTALDRTVKWYQAFYQSGALTSQQDLEQYIEDANQLKMKWAQ